MNDIFIAPKHKSSTESVLDKNPDSDDMGSLSSFCHNPKGVRFQTQKHDESIILFLRAHFITNISWIILSLIFITIPIITTMFLPKFAADFLFSPSITRFTRIYVSLYYLIIFSYLFVSFLHWFYNVFIVSSERIVDIDYSDIVVHNIAVASLNHVQDVNYTQSGFIPTFFNYGDVFVQTAGNERNFEALSIPRPREVTHIIGDLTGKGPK